MTGEAFCCRLREVDFESRDVTLRALHIFPPLRAGNYVVVPQAEWQELRERASGIEAGTATTVEQGVVHESPAPEGGDAQGGSQ